MGVVGHVMAVVIVVRKQESAVSWSPFAGGKYVRVLEREGQRRGPRRRGVTTNAVGGDIAASKEDIILLRLLCWVKIVKM